MATTPQTNATLEDIAEVIRSADDFVLCGHMSPDGDCIGSQLTLAHMLWSLGKKATCVLVRDEPVPESLAFLPGVERMVPAARYDGPCRVFVGLDVPTRERVGADACAILDRSETSITLDHHAVETTMCEHVYVDPDYASASMIVWELVKLLGNTPPAESALCAYVGLVTDTGGFRFQNTDVAAFEAASEFVGRGVNAGDVASHVFQNHSMAALKLDALTIDRLELLAGGVAAISWVSRSDMERLGATKDDADSLVDTVRSVAGVVVACMLREQDGVVRVNLRSKDETDVSALARKFDGGGHRAAAGLTLEMPVAEALDLMRSELVALMGGRAS